MNNSVWGWRGGVCGFTVRHWPKAGSAEADVTENQNERLYLCVLGEINHSEAEKLCDPPRAPVHAVNLCLHSAPHLPLFCMYLKLSSEAGNSVFPLMPQCLFHSLSHPRVLAAWLLFPPPPPPPPHLSPVPARFLPVSRQAAAGVLWLEDQRASKRRSPSELGCLCGRWREKSTLPFSESVLSFSLQQERERESAYPAPGWQEHRFSVAASVSYPCYTLASGCSCLRGAVLFH